MKRTLIGIALLAQAVIAARAPNLLLEAENPDKSGNFVRLAAMIPLLSTAVLAGPSSTGGGESGPCGDLLDFCEEILDPLASSKPFNPISDPASKTAVQQALYPWLSKLEQKVPGSAARILAGLNEMDWYFTDQPLAAAGDACQLVQTDGTTIGRQVGNKVALSRAWFNDHSQRNQAGIILHELVEHASGKKPADCTTEVRKMVRMIDKIDQTSEVQLRDQLKLTTGAHFFTRTEAKKIEALMKEPVYVKGCQKVPQDSAIRPTNMWEVHLPMEVLTSIRQIIGNHPYESFTQGEQEYQELFYGLGLNSVAGENPYFVSYVPGGCEKAVNKSRTLLGMSGSESEGALHALISSAPEENRASSMQAKELPVSTFPETSPSPGRQASPVPQAADVAQ